MRSSGSWIVMALIVRSILLSLTLPARQSLLQRHRHKIAQQRPRVRIAQMHDALEPRGRDHVAFRMIREGIDRAVDAFERRDRFRGRGLEDADFALVVEA